MEIMQDSRIQISYVTCRSRDGKRRLFALSWLGTNDIAEALLLSTIAQAYSNKVQAKLAGSKGKLPVMEDNFQALSFVDFEEIDQANLHEGIQR
nr:hypothetical protein Iba_chr04bCG15380 [Ipomoea batatas]